VLDHLHPTTPSFRARLGEKNAPPPRLNFARASLLAVVIDKYLPPTFY
jgi:hypothetical protein